MASSSFASISSPGSPAGSTTRAASTRGTSSSPIRSRWDCLPGFDEQRERARPQEVGISHATPQRGGIEEGLPPGARQRELDRVFARVEQQQEVVVFDRRAAVVALGELLAE